jgi:hypothetical protein
MKLVTFKHESRTGIGAVVEGGGVVDFGADP